MLAHTHRVRGSQRQAGRRNEGEGRGLWCCQLRPGVRGQGQAGRRREEGEGRGPYSLWCGCLCQGHGFLGLPFTHSGLTVDGLPLSQPRL